MQKKPRLKRDPNYVFKDKIFFENKGFEIDFIDIGACGKEIFKEKLDGCQAIYVKGGNSFYLLKSIKNTGVEEIIQNSVKNGIIYIGESAGAYIACPTIEMAEWKHQDRNNVELKDLSALALVSFLVTAHYAPEYDSILDPYIQNCNYEVRKLNDRQMILIEDEKESIIEV